MPSTRGTAATESERGELGLALSASADTFLVCDPAGRIVGVNDSLCDLAGYDHRDLLQKKIDDLADPGAGRLAAGLGGEATDDLDAGVRYKAGTTKRLRLRFRTLRIGGLPHSKVRMARRRGPPTGCPRIPNSSGRSSARPEPQSSGCGPTGPPWLPTPCSRSLPGIPSSRSGDGRSGSSRRTRPPRNATGDVVLADRALLFLLRDQLMVNALKFVRPGIAPEHHRLIFGLGERLHPAEESPGAGMGLALVGLESREGEGSVFWVELPCAPQRPSDPPSPPPPDVTNGSAPGSPG